MDILDAISIHASGNEHVVATMGGALTDQQILKLSELKNPARQFTMVWRRPDEEIESSILKLASFAWVHLAFPERDADIRDLSLKEVQELLL